MLKLFGILFIVKASLFNYSLGDKSGPFMTLVNSLPRGGNDASYSYVCDDVKSNIIESVSGKFEEMRRTIIDEGSVVDGFGVKADTICNSALEEFAQNAPETGNDTSAIGIYEKKLQELESALDAPLHVLYLRQLAIIREKALQDYRSASHMSEMSDYEAMLQSDSQFLHDATDATRDGSDWSYSSERSYLRSIMNDIASSRKKLIENQIKSSENQNIAMTFLQQQQQMIQQLQLQLYGQNSPWNIGCAYRIPDTNFNIQGSYQQGRANFQLSCVPDEYAPMLGPNGFTNGVGPGNLGLSLNLSI